MLLLFCDKNDGAVAFRCRNRFLHPEAVYRYRERVKKRLKKKNATISFLISAFFFLFCAKCDNPVLFFYFVLYKVKAEGDINIFALGKVSHGECDLIVINFNDIADILADSAEIVALGVGRKIDAVNAL